MSSESSIRDRIAQNDVTVARSYLEVDVMEWFAKNEIPFAYEAFVIPSVVGPSQNTWDGMSEAIRALGNGDEQEYESISNGTPLEDLSAFEALNMWNEIYDKHNLAGEQIFIPVRESLSEFRKTMILPDFALYLDAGIKNAPEGFDYGSYDYIVEVSGLWGVGLPGEATEEDWWDWYRVSAVAFKEYIYKLVGLWDNVFWVIPNQPFIEGISDGIPNELRDDDHYVIINTTSAGVELDKLEDAIGITASEIDNGLSPDIQLETYLRILDRSDFRRVDPDDLPVQASRDLERLIDEYDGFPTVDQVPNDDLPQSLSDLIGSFQPVRWEYNNIIMENIDNNESAVVISEDYIVFHGDLGEVYISDDTVHVRESQWRVNSMIIIREYVADVISQLEDSGIVDGVTRVN